MNQLVYEDLSYKLIGLAYEVGKTIGVGQVEKVYSAGLEQLLIRDKITCKRELYAPIEINGKVIARRYFDFLIEDKIVVELKVGTNDFRDACSQLYGYLKQYDIKLGLILRFTRLGVKAKRIPNIR